MKVTVWVLISVFVLVFVVVLAQQILHPRQATQEDTECLAQARDVTFYEFVAAPFLFCALYYWLCRMRKRELRPAATLFLAGLGAFVSLTVLFWLWMRSIFLGCRPGAQPPFEVFSSATGSAYPLIVLIILGGTVWNYLRVRSLPRRG